MDATLLAAVNPRAEGEVFNVGTGSQISFNVLVAAIGGAVGGAMEMRHGDRREIDNMRWQVVNIE